MIYLLQQLALPRSIQTIYCLKFYIAIENKSGINCLRGNSMNINDQKKKKDAKHV